MRTQHSGGERDVNIRSCVRGSTEHRNLSALPERSARGAAEGTTRGQRAKVSMRGRTEDAASNRQLAKLLSGFVTGQITVAKVVVTVAAQSLAWGK